MTLRQSDAVADAIAADWTSVCDGAAAISWYRFGPWRKRDAGPYRVLDVRAGDRRVQVSISPTGRSVQVYVDGEQV